MQITFVNIIRKHSKLLKLIPAFLDFLNNVEKNIPKRITVIVNCSIKRKRNSAMPYVLRYVTWYNTKEVTRLNTVNGTM